MAEFHRKTRGIGFLHRCMLNCNSHDLTLHTTLSDRAATIRPKQEFWAQRRDEQTAQTCDIAWFRQLRFARIPQLRTVIILPP